MKKAITIVLSLFLFSCHRYDRQPLKTGFEGKPLPGFNLLLNDSITYINTSNIPAGKPIVLFYFSPRCPYCRAEMDNIIQNITSLENIQFYVFTTWPFKEMNEFYKHYALNKYPNISTGVDYRHVFLNYFRPPGVPCTAIYRKDRKLDKFFVGAINSEQIKEEAQAH